MKKFLSEDELTWNTFLEACKEVDEITRINTNTDVQMPQSFSSIDEAEQYFRSLGGITVEEFVNKMREKYGN